MFGISSQGGGSTTDLTSLRAMTRHGALIGALVVLAVMAGALLLDSEHHASLPLSPVVGVTLS